jgi:hypothetical protein
MAVKPKEFFLTVDIGFLGPEEHIKYPGEPPALVDGTWPRFA